MSNYAVELCDVVKQFPNPRGREVTALDHVTLQFQPGEFFSLLGPSGCGKTTSLRLIGGFELPTQGEVLIQGQKMERTPPYLRPVNTVFQSYALFQHMTVAQNIAFGLEMQHLPNKEINRRVKEMLALVQLNGMGDRRPKQLSGGQQQRVALARALIKRPAVLLLDEPLGALDLKLRKEMQVELKELQNQVGITFIYVTHDQEEALIMSDRIAVMNKGKVLQMGRPVEIYERPTSRFVADFIGETNFLAGTVREVNGAKCVLSLDRLDLPVIGLKQDGLYPGARAIMSVRPEKMLLTNGCSSMENCLRGQVVTSAYVGSDTRVVVDLGEKNLLRVWEQNHISALVNQADYQPGQELWVALSSDNVMILPEE